MKPKSPEDEPITEEIDQDELQWLLTLDAQNTLERLQVRQTLSLKALEWLSSRRRTWCQARQR